MTQRTKDIASEVLFTLIMAALAAALIVQAIESDSAPIFATLLVAGILFATMVFLAVFYWSMDYWYRKQRKKLKGK